MYTQCPDCDTAFRVTAEVLKQAAGKVRCGGCGNAFNALAHLSESKPESAAVEDDRKGAPELTPDSPQRETNDAPPEAISPEQSAALLKTLDKLAGTEVRIEDTGVEWRLMSEDEEKSDDGSASLADQEEQATGEWFMGEDAAAPGDMPEVFQESPTPVDQFLTATPSEVESPEIFDDKDAPAPVAAKKARTTELRFDDNTGLPEDFEFDAPVSDKKEQTKEPEIRADAPDPEAMQADLALGEPDEWQDLLGEVEGVSGLEALEATGAVIAPEIEVDDTGSIEDELAEFEDDTPPDVDEQFALQAEAMGIDLSGIQTQIDALPEESGQLGILAGIPDDDQEPVADETAVTEIHPRDDDDVTELALEASAEPEVSPVDETVDSSDSHVETSIDEDLIAAAFETERSRNEPLDAEATEEFSISGEKESSDDEDDTGEPTVLPLSEEEQTINMMIDEDMMRLAIEEDDGLTSTMVLDAGAVKGAEIAADTKGQGKNKLKEKRKKKRKKKKKDKSTVEDEALAQLMPPGAPVETIVMEGEVVRGALDEDFETDKIAAKNRADAKAAMLAQRQAEAETAKSGHNYGMIAGIAALVVVLALQLLHQSREALATMPVFNATVGSVYRAIGQPVTPSWDVTGWRIEATRGSTDDDEQILTIYSRIGNKSSGPLPYPLISVSLTDRFEEAVGSRVLEPDEYLAAGADTRLLVDAASTFDAIIAIESPAVVATGFKLNVCYRASDGQLRCAIDDFK